MEARAQLPEAWLMQSETPNGEGGAGSLADAEPDEGWRAEALDERVSLGRLRRRLKAADSSLYAALRSIHRDAGWVAEAGALWPGLPLLPNLRCGLWYLPPPLWRPAGSSCAFKSTDGHTGNTAFSLTRLNLYTAGLAAEAGGCIIVDATRNRSKVHPDSMTKTIPVWCCVLNNAIHRLRAQPHAGLEGEGGALPGGSPASHAPEERAAGQEASGGGRGAQEPPPPWDCDLYVPPRWVSPPEKQRILESVPAWVDALLGVAPRTQLLALAQRLRKPLRPLWVPQRNVIRADAFPDPAALSFTPVILVSASDPSHLAAPSPLLRRLPALRTGPGEGPWSSGQKALEGGPGLRTEEGTQERAQGQEQEQEEWEEAWRYIPGAADDEESWARGLMPALFWAHLPAILGAGQEGCCRVVARLVEEERVRNAWRARPPPCDTGVTKGGAQGGPVGGGSGESLYPGAGEAMGALAHAAVDDVPAASCCWIGNSRIGVTGAQCASFLEDMGTAGALLACGVNLRMAAELRPCLVLPIRPCKKDRRSLLAHLPAAVAFCERHLREGASVALVCPDGKDLSVCVAIAILLRTAHGAAWLDSDAPVQQSAKREKQGCSPSSRHTGSRMMERQEVELASDAGQEAVGRKEEGPCIEMAREPEKEEEESEMDEESEEESASLLDGARPAHHRGGGELGPARVGDGGADVKLSSFWDGLPEGRLLRVLPPFLGAVLAGKRDGSPRAEPGTRSEGQPGEDVEQGGPSAGHDRADFLVRLQRRVEKVLLALGCCCLVVVGLLALLGLGVVIVWLTSPGPSGAGEASPGDAAAGASTPPPRPPGAGPGGVSSSGGGGGWVAWTDWFRLGHRKCSNVQVPIPAVGSMREAEKVGQLVGVALQDVERQRGLWRSLSQDLVGAVYARPGDQPRAGPGVQHWASLVQRMQAAAQLSRLRIPLLVGLEALHGLANVPGATVFPHAIGLGATHNSSLAQLMGAAEAQELASAGVRWSLGPTLSVCRNPRWGRCMECVGENERLVRVLNSRLEGLTGAPSGHAWDLLEQNRALVLPTARFFMAEAGTMSGRSGDAGSTEMGDDSALRKMHLRPFFDANVRGVQLIMLGEGQVNGQPIHNNTYLISILKKQYRFAGVIVSSFHGLSSILAPSLQVQVETVVNAGVDLILAPPGQHVAVLRALTRGLRSGAIRQERVNDAVRRVLRAKELSAHFDSPCAPIIPEAEPKAGKSSSSEEGKEAAEPGSLPAPGGAGHRLLARLVVQQSLVLLKNGGHGKEVVFPLPPLKSSSRADGAAESLTVYVGGTHADDLGRQCGGYTISQQGQPGAITEGITIVGGIEEILPAPISVVKLREGQRIELQGGQAFPSHTYALLAVGEEPYSGPEGDASAESLRLSQEAEDLILDSCNKVICIVVLVTGRPLDITGVLPRANAVIVAWLPGSEAGGVADVIFNEDLDFQGTLPLTWFRNATAQLPINFGDKNYDPLFPYGYGLMKSGLQLNGTLVSPGG